MSKSTVTKLFVGGLIAIVGGIVLAAVAFGVAYANGTFVMTGPDVTGINPSGFTATLIVLMTVGALATVGGAISQFVAWIGAVINTARLEDKVWFILLLVLGLLSFGFIAMLVYILAGPDATKLTPAPRATTGAAA